MVKYGLLTTSSFNIGDEIQCLAALRFLPRVDYLVHRERTDAFRCEEDVKLIMNHWWLWDKAHFPPSEAIDPLFVSFHLQYKLRNESFMTSRKIQYFKQHAPIGCRDVGTAEYLRANGIDAYFTGCLTTTLLPNPNLKHKFLDDYILCVDAPGEVIEAVKARTEKRVICIERKQNVCFSYEQRLKLAKFTLFLYHNAHCVITIALHAALPSTAYGTPVCVIDRNSFEAKTRFDGLEDCFHIVDAKRFVEDPTAYDINNPPDNPNAFLSIRENLVKKCREFTNFDREASVFEDSYNPVAEIAEIMPYRESNAFNSMFYATRKSLSKAFLERCILMRNRHDTNGSRKNEGNAYLDNMTSMKQGEQ